LLLAAGTLLLAQDFTPPPVQTPDADKLKAIKEKTSLLAKKIVELRKQKVPDVWLAEIEVYHRAADLIVKHNEFFQKEAADWTLEALDRGLLRASLVQVPPLWVNSKGFSVIRAYRSRVDGSVQPYAVTFPEDYGPPKKWRIDVVLHGRDKALTEVKFLHNFNPSRDAPKDQTWVQLDIFGRGNNAYRWAGEADVVEAVETFLAVESQLGRAQLLDNSRVVLRGFSMGGAGTWHLGLHRPDQWCLLGPGAGFTTTHGYAKEVPDKLPAYQEACLRIYDAVDYAENALMLPVVAYAGANDPQKQAALNIEERLKLVKSDLKPEFKLLIAPKLEHQFPPAWQQKAEEAYAPYAAKGREKYPSRVRFVTWTLKYSRCNWVEVLGLDQHYEKALVDAEKTPKGFTVRTTNVRALHLTLAPGVGPIVDVDIDGQSLKKVRSWLVGETYHLYLQRSGVTWQVVLPQRYFTLRSQKLQKAPGLQGPIDDAFTGAFLCVVPGPGGKAWHEATAKYVDADLERFEKEWSKYFRGVLPAVEDNDITNEDIADRNLILFGDPGSNSLIASVLDGLPLKWTQKEITFQGKTYTANDHVPVLIFPNPLNANRYVVLNSGHTFHAADFQKTNAMLYPRLGDYAILKLTNPKTDSLAMEVVTAGLFDEYWGLDKK
jgi:pimeloyl-ACP methyl ester carboxylesterase